MRPWAWLAIVCSFALIAAWAWLRFEAHAPASHAEVVGSGTAQRVNADRVLAVPMTGEGVRSAAAGIDAQPASTSKSVRSASASSRVLASEFDIRVADEFAETIDGVDVVFDQVTRALLAQESSAALLSGPRGEGAEVPRGGSVLSSPPDAEPGRIHRTFALPEGTALRTYVRIRALGFEDAAFDLELWAGGSYRAEHSLKRLPLEIAGVVRDENGRPSRGVELELRAIGDPDREHATTGPDGSFSFPLTRKRDATALFLRVGGTLISSVAESELGIDMHVVIPTPARISGWLFEPNGGRVGRARVQLSVPSATGSQSWLQPALVVDSGFYAFDPAPVGSVDLNVWRESEPGRWQQVATFAFTLSAGEQATHDVEVPELR